MSAIFRLLFVLVIILSANACHEGCDFVECENGGQCIEGDCHCPDDYRGVNCETWIDPCEEVVCLNEGECKLGICDCAPGYEGDTCQREIRTVFFGDYDVVHSCNSGSLSYLISLSEDTAVTNVLIANLYNSGNIVSATVDSVNMTIPSQVFGTGTIEGAGFLDDDILNLSYIVVFGLNTDSCTAVCQLQ
ncbi:MAG: hypothetical protein ACI85F_001964 [Bacteroidia bacterium]|jgi:hypothetical protein